MLAQFLKSTLFVSSFQKGFPDSHSAEVIVIDKEGEVQVIEVGKVIVFAALSFPSPLLNLILLFASRSSNSHLRPLLSVQIDF